ncbi:MAG: HAD family hydrolase [Candidatus Moduliflexus flocculans]|nr:HAD family hydrolase [Candidatus Moduliflexus flocculans]
MNLVSEDSDPRYNMKLPCLVIPDGRVMKIFSGVRHFISSPIFYRSFPAIHCHPYPLRAGSKKRFLPITPQDTADAMSILSINHAVVDTIIFDFDGTLAKLNINFDQMRRAITELVSRNGIDHQSLQHRFILEIIGEASAILRNHSLKKAQSFTEEAYRIIEGIEVEAAQRGELFNGTKELLTALENHSIQTGIITRNCSKAVHTVFPDISSYCRIIVCRDDVNHVKPHPEQLNLALSRLGSKANRSIMIGDHPLDIETGRNAGTLTAGVLTGHFQEDDFMTAGANLVLPQALDILKLLGSA